MRVVSVDLDESRVECAVNAQRGTRDYSPVLKHQPSCSTRLARNVRGGQYEAFGADDHTTALGQANLHRNRGWQYLLDQVLDVCLDCLQIGQALWGVALE